MWQSNCFVVCITRRVCTSYWFIGVGSCGWHPYAQSIQKSIAIKWIALCSRRCEVTAEGESFHPLRHSMGWSIFDCPSFRGNRSQSIRILCSSSDCLLSPPICRSSWTTCVLASISTIITMAAITLNNTEETNGTLEIVARRKSFNI